MFYHVMRTLEPQQKILLKITINFNQNTTFFAPLFDRMN